MLLPVTIDAAAVVSTRLWISPDGAVSLSARAFARVLALGMIAVSVAGNAASHTFTAYNITPPWWIVVAVAAIPPVMLGCVAHLAALSNRPAGRMISPAEIEAIHPPVPGEPGDRLVTPGGDLVSMVAMLVTEAEAAGDRIGCAPDPPRHSVSVSTKHANYTTGSTATR